MVAATTAQTLESWPEAAVAIAGIALVGSVIVVAVWQLLATWRTRMTGARETEYRQLAERAVEAHAETIARLDEAIAELKALRGELQRGGTPRGAAGAALD
jgi:hypothetical protein